MKRKLPTAARRGFRTGVRSVFNLAGRGRPAPPLVRRSTGSLRDDAEQLNRDSERLFQRDSSWRVARLERDEDLAPTDTPSLPDYNDSDFD